MQKEMTDAATWMQRERKDPATSAQTSTVKLLQNETPKIVQSKKKRTRHIQGARAEMAIDWRC